MPLPLHPYLRLEQVEYDLGNAVRRDPFGDRIHIIFGVLCCALLCGPTSFAEFAGTPLVVIFVLRIPYIWRTWGSFGVQPLFWAIIAWAVWQATTLAWSPNVKQGLHELGANRWVWVMWGLWPIMRKRMWLIGGVAIGMLLGNVSQLLHEVGRHWGVHWLTWPRLPDRNSGWWDPVIGGSLLAAALGLHLPAALMGRGKWRWIALGGVIVTLLGIGATGTRGAWLAAASLCELAISISVFRERPWPRMLARLGMVLVVTAAIVGAVFLVKGETIMRRASQARAEIARATNLEHPDFDSDMGGRVLMGALAIEAFKHHPIAGVGAGGYRTWAREQFRAAGMDPDVARIHEHPQSAPLHIAATTGIVGLLLAGAVAVIALRGAFRELGPPGPVSGMGSYAAGPGFALLGLLLAGMFDPVQLNAQTGAVMAVLMAMCLVSRPRELAEPVPVGRPFPPLRGA